MTRKFSLFENHKKTKPEPDSFTLEQVLNCLKSTALASVVAEASRARQTGNENKVKEIKSRIPCITPCGVFSQRNKEGLIEYSNIICIDLDKLPNPIETRRKFSTDPHIILAFLSPTHTGVKVWVVVDADAKCHSKTYRIVADYLSAKYGVRVDESGKDICRLCYLSHDPNAHYNASAIPLLLPPTVASIQHTSSPKSPASSQFSPQVAHTHHEVTREDARVLLKIIKSAVGRPPYEQWLRILNAVRSHFGDAVGKELLEECFPSENEREYDEKFAYPCVRIGIGTLIHEATLCGFDWTAYLKQRTSLKPSLQTLPVIEHPLPEVPFPIEVLPPVVKSVSENLAQVHQVPVVLPAMSALAVLSGAIGSAVEAFANHRGGTHLNLYVVLGAERGCGKSSVAGELIRPLQEESKKTEDEWRSHDPERRAKIEFLKEQKWTKSKEYTHQDIEKRAKQQKEIQQLEDELKYPPRLWMGDATSEALAKVLSKSNETILSFSSDAGDAIRVACGKYRDKGSDVEMFLKGWSGDAHGQDRIGRDSVRLYRPCISILWLVQGVILRELTGDPEIMERGFLARCFLIDTGARPQETPPNPSSFKVELREEWAALIKRLLAIRIETQSKGKSHLLKASPEAKEVFRLFGNESVVLGRTEYMDVAGELTRWEENAIRISGLFALVEESETISEEQAKRAVAVVRWCGSDYLKFLDHARRERL